MRFLFWFLCAVAAIFFVGTSEQQNGPMFPAFFIFGDSLVDVGNNNYIPSLAKGNRPPYGIDFPAGATGRFSNGRTVLDVVCELLGLPFVPAYLNPQTQGRNVLQGVNYASGAGGILDSSGYNYLARISMSQQINNFKQTLASINATLGQEEAVKLIASSFFATVMGNNDYINNYFLSQSPAKAQYSEVQFRDLLITTLSSQLKELYNLGVRTMAVASIGPLGCIPSQLAKQNSNIICIDNVNRMIIDYNSALQQLVSDLNAQLPGARFLYADTFTPVFQFVNDPEAHGFLWGNTGCCGSGKYNAQGPCLPLGISNLCSDRTKYVFWDPFHPTEAANEKIGGSLTSTGIVLFILRSSGDAELP